MVFPEIIKKRSEAARGLRVPGKRYPALFENRTRFGKAGGPTHDTTNATRWSGQFTVGFGPAVRETSPRN